MATKFLEQDVAEVIRSLGPARIFVRRRDPALRRVLKGMLPRDHYSLVGISDAPLLLHEVSGRLLSWEPGETIEISMADRPAPDGRRDILVAFRRPRWNPGVLLLTAFGRDENTGDEEEYGSALVLGPGVAISFEHPRRRDGERAARRHTPVRLAS